MYWTLNEPTAPKDAVEAGDWGRVETLAAEAAALKRQA
jgi:hypothetical protein